jgi:membrane protease YdiL (CAAX protease family)
MNNAARSLLAFLLVLLAAMLFAAVASPWVQKLLAPLSHPPLHRVFSRLMLLGIIVGVAGWIAGHGNRRELLGFNRPWPGFLRRVVIGLLAGLALMSLALMPLVLLHVRVWNERFPVDAMGWLVLVLQGLGSGVVVALIEETLFRGAMQGALQRIGATGWALLAVPVFYGAVHFLGRGTTVPYEEVNAWSGFVVWRGFFSAFLEPPRVLDAFVALYFVGVLLALVRQRWGDIAGCIGLHAGFVMVIAVFRRVSVTGPANEWSFLAGSFDGLLGIWIATVTALLCLALWRWRSVRTA